jgi:Tol biopolymer transport system component
MISLDSNFINFIFLNMKDMLKKNSIFLILFIPFLFSCKKNIIEQAGGPIPVNAQAFLTYTSNPSSYSVASEIVQVGTNDSNFSAITTSNNLVSRFNHNSTFTGYNTLVFSSDSLYDSVRVTALYQYNETTKTLKKLTSGLYRDENPSYSNYNNILAFTRDTAWVDTLPLTHPYPLGNTLYLNYFNKGITVGIVHFTYGKIGHSTWSPDGSTIYFDYQDSSQTMHIYSIKVDGSALTQITHSQYGEEYPSLSPDGKTLAMASFLDGFHYTQEISLINPDGTNPRKITNISSTAIAGQPCWSPKGDLIFFSLYDPGQGTNPSHIYSVHPDGTQVQAFTRGNGEAYPQSSYIAYP